MRFKYYSPTSRNVLLLEQKEAKTSSGLFIPSTSTEPARKWYYVVKAGKDCTEVKEGDMVRVMNGIYMESVKLTHVEMFPAETDRQMTPGAEWDFVQVMEQQIIGFCRVEPKSQDK